MRGKPSDAADLAAELLRLRQAAIEIDAPELAYLIDIAAMEAQHLTLPPQPDEQRGLWRAWPHAEI